MIICSASNIDLVQGALGYGDATEGINITDWRISNTQSAIAGQSGVFSIFNSSSITPNISIVDNGTVGIGTVPSISSTSKMEIVGNVNITGAYNINNRNVINDTSNYILSTSNALVSRINAGGGGSLTSGGNLTLTNSATSNTVLSIANSNISFIATPVITPNNVSGGTFTVGQTAGSIDRFMIFTAGTSSFTVPTGGIVCDILMIGGGGAGGYSGGGGGAGACIVAINQTLSTTGLYNVIVGAGDTASTATTGAGGDSTIGLNGGATLYIAKGGGRGEYRNNGRNNGGCGGGSGWEAVKTGGLAVNTNMVAGTLVDANVRSATFAVFGNKGGDRPDSSSGVTGAGGGGIGGAGGNHITSSPANLNAGPGGVGLFQATVGGTTYNFRSYFANGGTPYNFGALNSVDSQYYIGGGGGGSVQTSTNATGPNVGGIGGVGGGGTGGISMTFVAATGANGGPVNAVAGTGGTGGGGGGGFFVGGSGNGGNGGSGIVIIRYRVAPVTIGVPSVELVRGVAGDSNHDYKVGNYDGNFKIMSAVSGAADTERLNISSVGNVGIGTSSPANELHIFDSTTSATSLIIQNNNQIVTSNITQGTSTSTSTVTTGTSFIADFNGSTAPSVHELVTSSTTERIMIFKTANTNHTFTVPTDGLNCDVLMIGGGGGGGDSGAGAGSCIIAINQTLPAGSCVVNVGDGGLSITSGGDSFIKVDNADRYRAKGGGPGSDDRGSFADGGCGAGAWGGTSGRIAGQPLNTNVVNGITGIGPTNSQLTYAVLGNAGGASGNGNYFHGSGGGIGAVGVLGGAGGNGKFNVAINGIVYNFRDYFANGGNNFGVLSGGNYYIGGGGGGGSGGSGYSGGLGGGANSYVFGGGFGVINTGGGGTNNGNYRGGQQGGSGIIIIRYRTGQPTTTTTYTHTTNLTTTLSTPTLGTPSIELVRGTQGDANTDYKIGNYEGNFKIMSSISSIDTDRLLITSSGNVGIGTSNPANKLHIFDSITSNTSIIIQNNTSTIGTPSIELIRGTSGDSNLDYKLGNYEGNFKIMSSISNTDTERLLITSSGNVGIGTSNPANKLHIFDSITSNTSIIIQNNTSTIGIPLIELIRGTSGDSNIDYKIGNYDGDFKVISSTLTTDIERLNITSGNYTTALSLQSISPLPTIISSTPVATTSGLIGTDRYMIFTYTTDTSGYTNQTLYTITLDDNYTVDILVVGGGGGGGQGVYCGGGGGGGGIVYMVDKTLAKGSYKIIVGKGGAAGTVGNDSVIRLSNDTAISYDSISVVGKGGGAGAGGGGGSGGSGGGGSNTGQGAGTATQGNTFWDGTTYVAGGFNGGGGAQYGGGGGGSGEAGGTDGGPQGGDGRQVNITGTNTFYGGGGGGGEGGGGGDGGGGGTGSWGSSGSPGTSHTGGGGGGVYSAGQYSGGVGGSGVIIIRYRQNLPVLETSINLVRGNINDTNIDYKIGNFNGDFKIISSSQATDIERLNITSGTNTTQLALRSISPFATIIGFSPLTGTTSGIVGTDRYIIFTYTTNTGGTGLSEYTITLGINYNVDILVVGGGGGGGQGNYENGGGGGGGIVYMVDKTLVTGTYKVIVGNGGGAATTGYDSRITLNGTAISYDSISVVGKGGGPAGGGSGGSGAGGNKNGGAGTATQGNTFWNGSSYVAGGFNGQNGGAWNGGGGGGAGEAGGTDEGIEGGDGRAVSITGVNTFYGGGGAGGGWPNVGGDGGGGVSGGWGSGGGAGTPNTGGGGGGAFSYNMGPGGVGGSGIVIIRYRQSLPQLESSINLVRGTAGDTNRDYKLGNYGGDFIVKSSVSGVDTDYLKILGTDGTIYNKPNSLYWNQISDMRIKENIRRASYDLCYENVDKLELNRFNYIKEFNTGNRDTNQLGFIAQEINEIFPKAVFTNNYNSGDLNIQDMLSIDIGQINFTLYGAVKKLMEINKDKELRLKRLECLLNVDSGSSDTSNLTIDTSNLTIDTSNLLIDTSNLLIDTSHLPIDTSNLSIDTSNLSIDTSNLSIDSSNLTIDTSNLLIDTSNLPIDTSNLSIDTSNIPT